MASLGHNEFFDLISCLVQDCSTFIAGVLEALHSLTQPKIYFSVSFSIICWIRCSCTAVSQVWSINGAENQERWQRVSHKFGIVWGKRNQRFYILSLGPSGMSIETTIRKKDSLDLYRQEDKDKEPFILHNPWLLMTWWCKSQGISSHGIDPLHVLNSLWLVAWQHQANPWTSVDFSLMTFCSILIREQFHSDCSSYYFV